MTQSPLTSILGSQETVTVKGDEQSFSRDLGSRFNARVNGVLLRVRSSGGESRALGTQRVYLGARETSLVRVRCSTHQKLLMSKVLGYLSLFAVLLLVTRFKQTRVIQSSDGCNSDGHNELFPSFSTSEAMAQTWQSVVVTVDEDNDQMNGPEV